MLKHLNNYTPEEFESQKHPFTIKRLSTTIGAELLDIDLKRDLSQEEKLEQDVGYYRIDFRSERYEEFAMGDYTYDNGFEMHEFNPERLDINELKSAVRGLQ